MDFNTFTRYLKYRQLCLSGLNFTLKIIHRLVSQPEIQIVKDFLAVPDSAFLKKAGREADALQHIRTVTSDRMSTVKWRSINRRSHLTASQISQPHRVKSVSIFATFATFIASYTSGMLTC